jgi:DNA-binding response OmpR family regulator
MAPPGHNMIESEHNNDDAQHVLVVHEPAGRRWFDALRGLAAQFQSRIRHTVAIADTLSSVRAEKRCTILIDIGRNPLESLDVLEQACRLGPDVVAIVVAQSDQADLELCSRELGACAYLVEPLTGPELAEVVGSIMRLQLALPQLNYHSVGAGVKSILR